MAANGPKRTYRFAPHMSGFRGKADMAFCGRPLLRSLLAKRTCALQMSAHDPKRRPPLTGLVETDTVQWTTQQDKGECTVYYGENLQKRVPVRQGEQCFVAADVPHAPRNESG